MADGRARRMLDRRARNPSEDRLNRMEAALDFARSALVASLTGTLRREDAAAIVRLIERARNGSDLGVPLAAERARAIEELTAIREDARRERAHAGSIPDVVDRLIAVARIARV